METFPCFMVCFSWDFQGCGGWALGVLWCLLNGHMQESVNISPSVGGEK